MKRSPKRVDENLPSEDHHRGIVALGPGHGPGRAIGKQSRVDELLNHGGISRSQEVDRGLRVAGRSLRTVDLNLEAVIQDLQAVNHHLGSVDRGRAAGREKGKCPPTFVRAEE